MLQVPSAPIVKKKDICFRRCLSFGGDDRTRICDPLRVKQVLYRLSYASILVTRTRLELVLPP